MKKLALLFASVATLALLYAAYPLFIKEPAPIKKNEVVKPVEITKPVETVKPVEIEKPVPPKIMEDRGAKLFNSDAIIAPKILSMRERLMTAAQSGNLSRLKIAFETNEMMPSFSSGPERDPIAYWRKRSGDGEGREILSALANILALPAARINEGKPNEMVVYPYLAAIPLENLTPEQKVDLFRLLPPDEAKAMVQFGTYIYWRVGIGKDGTLHYFKDGK
jgi:hypothetical protein